MKDAIRIPQLIQMTLRLDDEIKELAKEFFQYRNFLYLGSGISYPGRVRRGVEAEGGVIYTR